MIIAETAAAGAALCSCRPALITVLLLLWLPETPSSLLQRGKLAEARLSLQRLRGMLHNTEQEYAEILQASRLFSTVSTDGMARTTIKLTSPRLLVLKQRRKVHNNLCIMMSTREALSSGSSSSNTQVHMTLHAVLAGIHHQHQCSMLHK
jgi:hypothetical protein